MWPHNDFDPSGHGVRVGVDTSGAVGRAHLFVRCILWVLDQIGVWETWEAESVALMNWVFCYPQAETNLGFTLYLNSLITDVMADRCIFCAPFVCT